MSLFVCIIDIIPFIHSLYSTLSSLPSSCLGLVSTFLSKLVCMPSPFPLVTITHFQRIVRHINSQKSSITVPYIHARLLALSSVVIPRSVVICVRLGVAQAS